MRARLLSEALKRGGDPLKTMDIGVSVDSIVEDFSNAVGDDKYIFQIYKVHESWSNGVPVYKTKGMQDFESDGVFNRTTTERNFDHLGMYVVIEDDFVRRYEAKSPSKSKKIPLVPGIYHFDNSTKKKKFSNDYGYKDWEVWGDARDAFVSIKTMSNLDLNFDPDKRMNLGEFHKHVLTAAKESLKKVEEERKEDVKEATRILKEERDRLTRARDVKKKLQGI